MHAGLNAYFEHTVVLSMLNIIPSPFTADHGNRGESQFLALDSDPGATPVTFKFVTECFFITQRALHVGLIPATNTFTQTSSDLGKQLAAKLSGGVANDKLKELNAVCQSFL